MTEILKACPCCGQAAELEFDPEGCPADEGYAVVKCMHCGLRTRNEYWTEVKQLWNQRVAEESAQEVSRGCNGGTGN
jgi:sarcosine oxidase delta subunit